MKRLLLLAALAVAAPVYSQTLTFGVETTNSAGQAVVPRPTWTTTPAAASCTASGGWSGTKAAAGTELLAAINVSTSYSLSCNWPGVQSCTVTWTAPTTNEDGSAYTNPGGFRVQYGTSAANLSQSVYLQDPAARTWSCPSSPALAPGIWYFGVRAFNAQGLEAQLSNVASKTLTAAATKSASQEIVVKFPGKATNVTVE